jgi:hypothetical protein
MLSSAPTESRSREARNHRLFRTSPLPTDLLPLLFLYRHAIELLSKGVILSGNRLMAARGAGRSEKEVFDDFKRSKHALPDLLPAIESAFAAAGWEWYWPSSRVETIDSVRAIFADLDAFGLGTMVATLDDLAEALDTAIFGLGAERSAER